MMYISNGCTPQLERQTNACMQPLHIGAPYLHLAIPSRITILLEFLPVRGVHILNWAKSRAFDEQCPMYEEAITEFSKSPSSITLSYTRSPSQSNHLLSLRKLSQFTRRPHARGPNATERDFWRCDNIQNG